MTHKFLTPNQVADVLQIQERTVTRWLRDGYLRGFKIGKEWRIDSLDLNRFLEQNANHDQPPVAESSQSPLARKNGEKVLH